MPSSYEFPSGGIVTSCIAECVIESLKRHPCLDTDSSLQELPGDLVSGIQANCTMPCEYALFVVKGDQSSISSAGKLNSIGKLEYNCTFEIDN